MKYEFAPDIQKVGEEICMLFFPHVIFERVKYFRSYGTSTKRTIARCHTVGKIMQKAMGMPAYYALEFIHEKFDNLSEEEKVKTVIHELMHIPKSFGGGFRHHDHVCDKNINFIYKKYEAYKK